MRKRTVTMVLAVGLALSVGGCKASLQAPGDAIRPATITAGVDNLVQAHISSLERSEDSDKSTSNIGSGSSVSSKPDGTAVGSNDRKYGADGASHGSNAGGSGAGSESGNEVEQRYNVERGDTLSGIAARTHHGVDELAKINDIRDVNLIYEGEWLIIPKNS